ncbi:MAG: hypothetical protein AAGC68_15520 [Verrucomicrobiota bacterium]
MKDPIRILVGLVVEITIGLVVVFFFSGDPDPGEVEPPSSAPDSAEEDTSGAKDDFEGWGDDSEWVTYESIPEVEEDDIAIPVEGEPLLVTLIHYPEIGQISIEKYDREGQATGKPLKSGTKVQIPNPNRPGEKIRFVVP